MSSNRKLHAIFKLYVLYGIIFSFQSETRSPEPNNEEPFHATVFICTLRVGFFFFLGVNKWKARNDVIIYANKWIAWKRVKNEEKMQQQKGNKGDSVYLNGIKINAIASLHTHNSQCFSLYLSKQNVNVLCVCVALQLLSLKTILIQRQYKNQHSDTKKRHTKNEKQTKYISKHTGPIWIKVDFNSINKLNVRLNHRENVKRMKNYKQC